MLDHTADVGFEVEAPSVGELLREALRGLLLVVFEVPPQGDGTEERRVELSAPDLETLLVRWLNELVFLIQGEGFVPVGVEVEVGEGLSLRARLRGVQLDVERYGWQGEIKGATFHGLEVVRRDGALHARVILDV
ncbi:archease [Rubrobacter xylanophilus]|nr:archease [Rubrobacter xylanophilus]